MTKDLEINDILSAVKKISQIERKKSKTQEIKNDSDNKDDVLPDNNQAKSDKSDILVLDQMIDQNSETCNRKKLDDYTMPKLFEKIYR